jgi:hypothetical protein
MRVKFRLLARRRQPRVVDIPPEILRRAGFLRTRRIASFGFQAVGVSLLTCHFVTIKHISVRQSSRKILTSHNTLADLLIFSRTLPKDTSADWILPPPTESTFANSALKPQI